MGGNDLRWDGKNQGQEEPLGSPQPRRLLTGRVGHELQNLPMDVGYWRHPVLYSRRVGAPWCRVRRRRDSRLALNRFDRFLCVSETAERLFVISMSGLVRTDAGD